MTAVPRSTRCDRRDQHEPRCVELRDVPEQHVDDLFVATGSVEQQNNDTERQRNQEAEAEASSLSGVARDTETLQRNATTRPARSAGRLLPCVEAGQRDGNRNAADGVRHRDRPSAPSGAA